MFALDFFIPIFYKPRYLFCCVFHIPVSKKRLVQREVLKWVAPVRAWLDTKLFPCGRESIHRTYDDVQSEATDEQSEPEGMVHVKEIYKAKQFKHAWAQTPCKLHAFPLGHLWNDCTQNRCDCHNDQEHDGKPDRAEETPDGVCF
jgi:hypothetical protein